MEEFYFNHKEQEYTQFSTVLEESKVYNLVLYNDDVNTFDWVIESLIEVCKHDPIQAEQCALIVHNNGKCTILSGLWDELETIQRELSNRELSVEIH